MKEIHLLTPLAHVRSTTVQMQSEGSVSVILKGQCSGDLLGFLFA